MIRLAFLGVLAFAGLLAFGAFFLARGSQTVAPSIDTATPAPAIATNPADPEVEKHYALRDIDLAAGAITLVLFPVGTVQPVQVVRDTGAVAAAQDTLYFTDQTDMSDLAYVQIYRDDRLVSTVMCGTAPCRSLGSDTDGGVAALLDTAIPIELVRDSFDTYDAYISTINAVSVNPDFMFLDARPDDPFPVRERVSSALVDLPSVVMASTANFDVAIFRALLSEAIAPNLPEGASISATSITPLDPVVLGDRDNNQPVLLQGAPIVFGDVQMHGVQVLITGTADLDDATLIALDNATRQQMDFASAFDSFVATRVQTDCADCLIPLLDDRFVDTAQVNTSTLALYDLSYYDLREAP